MYSLNAPVPPAVARLASGLAADLLDATVRQRHTLVVKRLGEGDPSGLSAAVRRVVAGTDPFPARVTGVDVFEDPLAGESPVAYLEVKSPGLEQLHRRLCERFDPVDGIEADAYAPHVTVARGGDADRLRGRDLDREWTVNRLLVWSGRYEEPVETVALP
ncbi:phosphoesterase [Halobacteriales archaeon QS_9_68_42]|nr:MAG: phosphoesterase [Halobacteriales archaeon QS_9_68_42]